MQYSIRLTNLIGLSSTSIETGPVTLPGPNNSQNSILIGNPPTSTLVGHMTFAGLPATVTGYVAAGSNNPVMNLSNYPITLTLDDVAEAFRTSGALLSEIHLRFQYLGPDSIGNTRTATIGGVFFNVDLGAPLPTSGCTDPRAVNYNSAVTIDDGSCILPAAPVRGCTDPTAINYNSLAAQSDGSCLYAVPVPTTTPPFVTVCPCLWTATLLPIKAWAIVVPPVGTWIQKPC